MTRKEYDNLRLQLIQQHEMDLKILAKRYCFENNPYKVGDVFTDHIGSIKIEKIKFSSSTLCCVYEGVELKKDLTPVKRGTKRKAWQINDVKN